jgi:hypothetical protein
MHTLTRDTSIILPSRQVSLSLSRCCEFLSIWQWSLTAWKALHVLIYNMGISFGGIVEQQSRIVQTALRNWKAVWNRRLSIERSERCSIALFDVSIEPEGEVRSMRDQLVGCAVVANNVPRTNVGGSDVVDWRRPGFWRHASEYWLLVQVFLEQMQIAQSEIQQSRPPYRHDLSDQIQTRILDRCDEADTSKLHNFLAAHRCVS